MVPAYITCIVRILEATNSSSMKINSLFYYYSLFLEYNFFFHASAAINGAHINLLLKLFELIYSSQDIKEKKIA